MDQNAIKKLQVGLFIIFIIIMVGSIGYMLIEGWTFFDSFYMTIITISTTGFKELRPHEHMFSFS